MQLKLLPGSYTVCQIPSLSHIDWSGELTFIGKTADELSLVCETALVPAQTLAREDDWRAFRVQGVLDFSLIGILSALTAVLAQADVSVFCVSTYDTDYVLVKQDKLPAALSALSAAGYNLLTA